MRKVVATIISLSLVPATAAMAEKKKDQSADMGDPNRVICETIKKTGSRLAKERACHTAAEWAEMRRQQRLTTDRVQAFKPCQVGAGPSGGEC
ncbi:hypothetical protein [Allosphingosinicella sp.]|uniref:hypothetical protein n=1 Tax=Allosphingosinicella sp. TaxID=2823234 RepID=UPI002FC15A76